jgi:hypothetical protein
MAAFAAQPVTMPPPREWPATAGWRIEEFPAGCAASRNEGGTALALVLLVEGGATVAPCASGLRRGSGAVRLRYRFDAASVEYGSSAPRRRPRANGYVTQLRAAEAQDFTAALCRRGDLARRRTGRSDRDLPAPGHAPLPCASCGAASQGRGGQARRHRARRRTLSGTHIRWCIRATVRPRRRRRPAAGPHPPAAFAGWKTAPRPALLRSGTITNDDYPAAGGASCTRGGGRQGPLHGPESTGESPIARSSSRDGFAILDATTCILIQRRFRFQPALDAAGR